MSGDKAAKQREANRRWRESHPGGAAAASQRWRDENPGAQAQACRRSYAKHKAARDKNCRDYYHRNREEQLARNAAWRRRNPERNRIICAKRRAHLKNAPIRDLTYEQWMGIKALHGNRCHYCGGEFERLTMDHVIPLSKGGSHTAGNVVPACRSCNAHKKDRIL